MIHLCSDFPNLSPDDDDDNDYTAWHIFILFYLFIIFYIGDKYMQSMFCSWPTSTT